MLGGNQGWQERELAAPLPIGSWGAVGTAVNGAGALSLSTFANNIGRRWPTPQEGVRTVAPRQT
ncbi:hypothetical protein ACIRPT_24355 [Streptomyces sp. NPDC101227]|uniref:hypothetical protein n=1 Tax=Streptomyces sp. NPDC101227 TaxID=3366136 RepID=UPI00380F6C48